MKDRGHHIWFTPYIWDAKENPVRGIAIMCGKKLRHFIPLDDVLTFSNQLIDLYERMESETK